MPATRTYHQRSFAPFPIMYSSESFAPLVREDRQITHVCYLLRGQHAALARFCHYLTDCSTIFALKQTLQELRDNRDHIFADFTTPDIIYWLQPFLIQSRRRSLAPASIATTTTITDTSFTYSWPPTQRPQEHTLLLYKSPRCTMTTCQSSLLFHVPPPSLLLLPLTLLHQFLPPVLVSFDMSLPSSQGLIPATVVVPLMAISLDALTEVGVFRANRGVVSRFSCFSCFFSKQHICYYFFYCDIFCFAYAFLCCGMFYFWFGYASHCLCLNESSHESLEWLISWLAKQVIGSRYESLVVIQIVLTWYKRVVSQLYSSVKLYTMKLLLHSLIPKLLPKGYLGLRKGLKQTTDPTFITKVDQVVTSAHPHPCGLSLCKSHNLNRALENSSCDIFHLHLAYVLF